ncbi:MAG: helix-turn-helix domain-containing protein [Clostridia bacterium]|nr:helix-turn-helix domain-containing protein [Clostridia bacterium]
MLTALLTVEEAARVCNVSRSRMYHIVAAREIAVHVIGRSVRISEEDLNAYLAGRRRYSKNEIIQVAADRAARHIEHGNGGKAVRPARNTF